MAAPRRWGLRFFLIVVLAAGLGTMGYWLGQAQSGDRTQSQVPSTTVEVVDEPLSFVVDDSLKPAIATVPGLNEGDAERPVGRLVSPDGIASDLVLNELIVSVTDRTEIEDFLQRRAANVVDQAPPGDDGVIDLLLTVDPAALDVAALAGDLRMIEPEQEGEYRAGSEEVLQLLAVAAAEGSTLEVSINWVGETGGIPEGTAREDPTLGGNAFDWPFIEAGGAHDIAVGLAWQLLHFEGVLDARVPIMIMDGGFVENQDFPEARKIRKAQWGDGNPLSCTGGASCPFHGTNVAIAAMGQVDNDFGGVGPAGPIGELIAVSVHGGVWDRLRRMVEVVEEERPVVVNHSWGTWISIFKAASERVADRRFAAVRNMGAIIFAAAGNDARSVDRESCIGNSCWEQHFTVPCESRYVICVGGLRTSEPIKHDGSNWGTDGGDRTVEIYAPICTVGLGNPHYPDSKTVCGTSFSSPFVAGVAALVKAADPSLSPSQIWEVLANSAHTGDVFADSGGEAHRLRVYALGAVAEVLGVNVTGPNVEIEQPTHGETFFAGELIDFAGEGSAFTGAPLPLTWTSSTDGSLTDDPTFLPPGGELSIGTHVITAEAVDAYGRLGGRSITIHVEAPPPELSIVSPTPGTTRYTTQQVKLVAFTKDPVTFQSLSEEAVTWEVRRQGQAAVAFSGEGHVAAIPINTLTSGDYVVTVKADNQGAVVEAETEFTMLAVPAGENLPNVDIASIEDGDVFSQHNDQAPTIALAGFANDLQDGAIGGTRFRWTALSDQGDLVVLCEGSNFPQEPEAGVEGPVLVAPRGGGPTLVAATNCADFEVEVGLAKGSVGNTVWTIRLEVADSAGLIGVDEKGIEVVFVTG